MGDREPAELMRRARPGGRTARTTKRIFATTLELLRDNGLTGVSFNDIAAGAEVNRSTLYRRWPERNELVLDAILDSVTEQIVPHDWGSLEREMADVLQQIGDYLATPLGRAVLIAGLELSSKDSPAAQRTVLLWRERLRDFDPMFDRAVTRGDLRPDFDRETALAMAEGAVYMRIMIHNRIVDQDWISRIIAHWHRVVSF